jgi:hypothetical protein
LYDLINIIKKRWIVTSFRSSLVFSLMFLPTGDALACLCESGSTKRRVTFYRKRSLAVFVGTVKELMKEEDIEGFPEYRAVLVIEKSWKGAPSGEITVYTPIRLCGAGFEVGGTYLVFAGHHSTGEPGKLETTICSTRRIEDATKELKLLGTPSSAKALQNEKVESRHVGSLPLRRGITGHDKSLRVRCSKLTPSGGREQRRGEGRE